MTLLRFSISTIAGIAFLALSGLARERTSTALLIGAVLFFAYALGQIIDSLDDIYRQHRWSEEGLANAVKDMDINQFNALGFRLPFTQIRVYQGKPVRFFMDTQATEEQWLHFLETSNDKTISPKRNWVSREYSPRAWHEIYTWLKKNNYIYEDRNLNNESWLWRGNAYHNLWVFWQTKTYPDLQEVEGAAAGQGPIIADTDDPEVELPSEYADVKAD